MNRKSRSVGRMVCVGIGLAALLGGSAAFVTARAQEAAKKRPIPAGKITPWAAMKIAVGKVPGGTALNADFELDEGHWIYGVFVVAGNKIKEVEIDPQTGKVGDVEAVTPDGEGKEVAGELRAALKGGSSAEAGDKESGEKDEKDEKP